MSDLYLLRGSAHSGHWLWRRISGPEPQTGISEGDCEDAKAALKGQRVVLVLAGERIAWHPLDLPLTGAKLLAAAPFALEDALAQDIDELHFSLAPPGAAKQAGVFVAEKEWLASELEQAAELEADEIVAAIPDFLLLPAALPGQVSLASSPQKWLLRLANGMGLSLPPDSMPGLVQSLIADQTVAFASVAGAAPPAELSIARRADVTDIFELLDGIGSVRQASLLHGEFASQSRRLEWIAHLKLPAALAATALLLHCLTLFWAVQQTRSEVAATDQLAQQTFSATFPNITRIVDMRVQAEQELAAASAGGNNSLFLELMTSVSGALKTVSDLRLEGVQYRDSAVYLSLSGSDLQALERLRNEIGRQPSLRLEIQSAQAGSDGVQIRLKLEKA